MSMIGPVEQAGLQCQQITKKQRIISLQLSIAIVNQLQIVLEMLLQFRQLGFLVL